MTEREREILQLLQKYRGEVLSAERIYRLIWKQEPFGAENVVAVHIYHLRKEMKKDPFCQADIKTHWKRGYEWIEKERL